MPLKQVVLVLSLSLFLTTGGYAQYKKYDNATKVYLTMEGSGGAYLLSKTDIICPTFKLNAYWINGKNFKLEGRNYAKDRGKNAYLNYNLSFLTGLRYTKYPETLDESEHLMGNITLSLISGKVFLCFVNNPRFFMDLGVSLEGNKKIGMIYSVQQDFYYYIGSRCALGLGIGMSVPFDQTNNVNLDFSKLCPFATSLIYFDLFDLN